jgi:fimbrial chaperone protein
MIRFVAICFFFMLLSVLAGEGTVFAGSWQVLPIRVDLSAKVKTEVVTIINNGDEPLFLEMRTLQWLQDGAGKDTYTETEDLVFFPKKLSIPPREERIVRLGIRAPQTVKERTYRLFIREIPEPKSAAEGTGVAIAIEFGVPIFVKPFQENLAGAITSSVLREEQAQCTISNTGNVHFRINNINFSAKNANNETIFSQEVNGWYLLAGTARTFSTLIPAELCPNLATIDIQAKANQLTLNGKIDVDPASCPTR